MAAAAELILYFDRLNAFLAAPPSGNVDRDYDQIVAYGELWSTLIVSAHLRHTGLANIWIDARTIVRTDSSYRAAKVEWTACENLANATRQGVLFEML